MNSKTINNLVFFKFNGEREGMKQACVFYNDGNVKMISEEEGIALSKELAKENGLNNTKDFTEAFRKLVNKKLIHVVSGEEFERNFQKYRGVIETKNEVVSRKKNEMVVAPAAVVSNKVTEEKEDTIDEEKYFKEVRAKVERTKAEEKKKKKRKPFSLRIAAGVVAAVVGVSGLAYGLVKKDKSGEMHKYNLKTSGQNVDNKDELVKDNNDYYNSYTFEELQEVTNNKTQKNEMKRIHDALYAYNIDFANAHVEKGKDIKAALTFDEFMALSQAYNNFTPKQIKAIYNGEAVKAADLDANYKTATLQLMGAHVIETRENPVDMSGIIVSKEGKAFYNKYHELFLAANEATGEDKIAKVEAFYREVRNDFPIDPDTREVGISHSASHKVPESYMLSITPMVAAGEIMWQNLDVDKTLQGGVNKYFLDFADFEGMNEETAEKIVELLNEGKTMGEIDYFNDLGLCNQAEDQFETVQQVTMGTFDDVDKTNPLLDQYRNAMVNDLKAKNSYFIDDAHRELSLLDAFQDKVNWHFGITDGYYNGKVWYTTETRVVRRHWTVKKKTTRTEETREEKPIPDDEKEKIDKQIEEENKKAKEEGEKKAEEKAKEEQEKEDKHAEEVEKEVEEDKKDMDEKIEDANDQIDENNKDQDTSNDKPVNEDDFGDHNVDFDDDHSDDNGNLDDSVKDITTDPSDAKTPSDLPDPNETGKKFDEEGEKSAPKTTESKPAVTESKPAPAPAPAPAPEVKSSNEKIVNDYVEEMANTSDSDDNEKTLSK